MAFVKHRDEVDATRKEASLQCAHDGTTDDKACKRLRDALTDGYNAPAQHDRAEKDRRSHLLENDIAWHFEQDVQNEEHEESDVVIGAMHVEVCRKPWKIVSMLDSYEHELNLGFEHCRC